jgi:hypothetical protein
MISSHERSDLIHIMKINRLTLGEADTAHLTFNGRSTRLRNNRVDRRRYAVGRDQKRRPARVSGDSRKRRRFC